MMPQKITGENTMEDEAKKRFLRRPISEFFSDDICEAIQTYTRCETVFDVCVGLSPKELCYYSGLNLDQIKEVCRFKMENKDLIPYVSHHMDSLNINLYCGEE